MRNNTSLFKNIENTVNKSFDEFSIQIYRYLLKNIEILGWQTF